MKSKWLVIFLSTLAFGTTAQEVKKTGKPLKSPFGLFTGINQIDLSVSKNPVQAIRGNAGFFAGAFFEPFRTKRTGIRSEILFSRQGFDYEKNRRTGMVRLDYLIVPQLASIRLTPFLDLHGGGQMAILLRGKVDSMANPSSMPAMQTKLEDYFNRVNYGMAAGLALRPLRGLSIGGRYNLFLNLLKPDSRGGYPDYVPDYSDKLRSGVWQLYLGYQF